LISILAKNERAVTKIQASVIAIIIIAAVVGGVYYAYVTLSAQEPEEEFILRMVPEAPGIATLDPANPVGGVDKVGIELVYDTLVEFDVNIELIPGLATSWEPVGLDQWIFHLREGVVFHDGTPLNSTAVKFSFERMTDARIVVKGLTRIETPDEYTAVFVTSDYIPSLPWIVANPFRSIVNPVWVQEHNETFYRNPCGTGPFELANWVEKEYVELVRNDEYWGKAPELDRIIIRNIPDESTRFLALTAGDVDLIVSPPSGLVPAIEDSPDLTMFTSASNRMVGIWINSLVEPFTDVRVRRAVYHAIDKPTIMEYILENLVSPAETALGPFTFGKLPDDTWGPGGRYPYDPDESARLLAEAGWTKGEDGIFSKNGEPLSITLLTPDGRYYKDVEMSEIVVDYLKQVGIAAKFEVVETTTFFKLVTAKDTQLYILGWGWEVYPEPYLSSVFYAGPDKNSSIWASWKDPETDALMEQALQEVDEALREKLYNDIERSIMDHAIVLPMYYKMNIWAGYKYLKNLVPYADESLGKMLDVAIEK